MQVRGLGLWAGVAVTYSVQVRALVNLLSAGQGVGQLTQCRSGRWSTYSVQVRALVNLLSAGQGVGVVGWGGGNLLSAGQGRF